MTQYQWGDLYGAPPQVVPLDEAGESLLNLIPADKRADMEPMLRGMLTNMRLQLGEANYAHFCADMRTAYEYHVGGKSDLARQLFAAYGIPYEMLVAVEDGAGI